ncbi:MAG: 16S rRNA (guanine(527)-N(7))-methyltransferase RsmG [Prevotella sp.]|jgi:16S rRNA methyltransferase gidB|nr:16S rRNA (guanine(527)-N(7))-methyltransferase RsmG [uncultured Prevotella sp.]MBF1573064.1 16S rRNA (guanine(527)-N(7))-methyltransferase RsmG [Prevotella sp.]
MTELISKYFPHLSAQQQEQFARLDGLYREWNAKINVISRKDMDNLYLHHVLHSLAIGKAIRFKNGTRILDFGTGGGFPGIPLAILFPQCQFRLIDGTGKKITVAKAVASDIGLQNVEAIHRRGEEETSKFDFVVSRAVMPLPDLAKIVRKNIRHEQRNASPNGLICLKGGTLVEELKPFQRIAEVIPLTDFFDEEWFKEEKKLVYIPIQ